MGAAAFGQTARVVINFFGAEGWHTGLGEDVCAVF